MSFFPTSRVASNSSLRSAFPLVQPTTFFPPMLYHLYLLPLSTLLSLSPLTPPVRGSFSRKKNMWQPIITKKIPVYVIKFVCSFVCWLPQPNIRDMMLGVVRPKRLLAEG
jgi:hypothetical protein